MTPRPGDRSERRSRQRHRLLWQLQLIPRLIVTPLTFLGGASGFRWRFYDVADVNVVVSFGMTAGFLITCLQIISWIFKTGYRLKN